MPQCGQPLVTVSVCLSKSVSSEIARFRSSSQFPGVGVAMSELVWAIKNGDIDQVKDIVENKKIDVNESISGRVPLHYAADYGQSDVVSYLLRKGADPNMIDKHGISVLLAAIWEGHTDCVEILLSHGAEKSGVAPDGTTYLEAAEKQEIKQLLT